MQISDREVVYVVSAQLGLSTIKYLPIDNLLLLSSTYLVIMIPINKSNVYCVMHRMVFWVWYDFMFILNHRIGVWKLLYFHIACDILWLEHIVTTVIFDSSEKSDFFFNHIIINSKTISFQRIYFEPLFQTEIDTLDID